MMLGCTCNDGDGDEGEPDLPLLDHAVPRLQLHHPHLQHPQSVQPAVRSHVWYTHITHYINISLSIAFLKKFCCLSSVSNLYFCVVLSSYYPIIMQANMTLHTKNHVWVWTLDATR